MKLILFWCSEYIFCIHRYRKRYCIFGKPVIKKNQAHTNACLWFSALSTSPLNHNLRGKHVKLKVNLHINSSPGRTNAWGFAIPFCLSAFFKYVSAWCLFSQRCSFLDCSCLNKVSLCDISVLTLSLLRSVSFWCSFIRERKKSLPYLRPGGTGVHVWNSIFQKMTGSSILRKSVFLIIKIS